MQHDSRLQQDRHHTAHNSAAEDRDKGWHAEHRQHQAIESLERQIGRLEHYPEMRRKLEEHLGQTRGQQAALAQAFNLLETDPSKLKASVVKVAANIQGMLHAFASDEVMKHALASYAFEQFEAACYRALVTAAEQAGEREVASTCATILREEEDMAAWLGASAAPDTTLSAAGRDRRGSQEITPGQGITISRGFNGPLNKDRRNKYFERLFLDGLPDCWRLFVAHLRL